MARSRAKNKIQNSSHETVQQQQEQLSVDEFSGRCNLIRLDDLSGQMVMVVAQDNAGKGHRSLMVLEGPVGRHVVVQRMVLRMYMMAGMVVRTVMVLIIGSRIVVILLLSLLPLRVLLVLHPPILEPDFHLSLG